MMRLFIAVSLLLLAAALRLYHASYGIANRTELEACLTPAEEVWLYDDYQGSSWYRWNLSPNELQIRPPDRVLSEPLVSATTHPLDVFFFRLSGVGLGLLTVALTIHLAIRLKSNWWSLAGLFVVVAPWFIAADRWIIRFDAATFCAAVSSVGLLHCYHHNKMRCRPLVWIQVASALSLWIVAPPLWWLSIGLILLQPGDKWRFAIFTAIAMFVTLPSLQTLEHWLYAAQQWDSGTLSACTWIVLALCLWRWRVLPRVLASIVAGAALVAGGMGVWNTRAYVVPSDEQWTLIHWLQARLPDEAVVTFDSATWLLHPLVSCPAEVDLSIRAQPQALPVFEVRELLDSDYVVTANAERIADMPYVYTIAERFYVGRSLAVPNPTDVGFGDLVYILSSELVTPSVTPESLLDIRLDYQFGAALTVDALRYAAFVHVTEPGDPGTKLVDYSVPLFEESGNFGARSIVLNDHIRVPIPASAPAGTYDVLFGFFDVYTGERLGWSNGDSLLIGQVTVTPAP